MTDWREVKLGDICDVRDGTHDTPKESPNGKYLVTSKHIKGGRIDLSSAYKISLEDFNFVNQRSKVDQWDILISMIGTVGEICLVSQTPDFAIKNVGLIKTNNEYLAKYLYYYLKSPIAQNDILSRLKGTTQQYLSLGEIRNFPVVLPPLDIQQKIAEVLGALDDKIELNNKINQNLELQAQALFKSWFVDKINPNRKTIKAEEFFNITIGKTPPRKEPEWFSKNTNDIKWISISDMGNCGVYISDSSEYLVPESISKFNVKIVPDNTVLLSFKLTVGRIAITDGEMATNEAIAHFGTDKKEINEYLYYYLKNFNFQTMGSTSSIATAVNSKIIKSMPFVMPEESELKDFHSVISPMFAQIKANQRENIQLSALRDTLLPKLMSGEINVDNVKVSDGKE